MKYQIYFFLSCLIAHQLLLSVCCDEEHDDCYDGVIDWPSLDSDVLSELIKECLTEGFSYAKTYQETALVSRRTCSSDDCTIFESVHAFKSASYISNVLSLCQGQGMLKASILLKRRLGLSTENVLRELAKIPISEEICHIFNSDCDQGYKPREYQLGDNFINADGSETPSCAYELYRTFDGHCNNLINITLGSSFQPFNRLLPPVYDDGLTAPRGYLDNNLPLPRAVSKTLSVIPPNTEEPNISQMVKTWGQFLGHDITRTPETSAGMGEDRKTLKLDCCEDGELRPEFSCEREHVVYEEPNVPECLPVIIPKGDKFFESVGIKCLEFIRSAPADQGCKFGPREQLNEVTSFIDGSNVYGSTKEENARLRLFDGGKLLTSMDMLGNMTIVKESCPDRDLYFLPASNSSISNQYIAGDTRSNEQPSLTSLHTIWMRIHNKIAGYVNNSDEIENDEMAFLETRRIVIALMQHITYSEFLPKVIGNVAMNWYHLQPLPYTAYNFDYDPLIDPRIVNVFGHAAFRFGHTLVNDSIAGKSDILLGDNFFQSSVLFQTNTTQPTEILASETSLVAEPSDAIFDEVLTHRLFSQALQNQELKLHGSDLMALNIQRGRDHGLPSYLEWRRYCGFSDVYSFAEMGTVMDPKVANAFAHLYESVEDVDLFPAALAENKLPGGGILGPTFSCILAEQFNRLKYGDRFFFENGLRSFRFPFTTNQLRLIKKTTFGNLLCDVTCSTIYPHDVFGVGDRPAISCFSEFENSPILGALQKGNWYD